MPAARLWRRVRSYHERTRKETQEKFKVESQLRSADLFTIARAISYAFYLNRDLPPTKKESQKKKPSAQDWQDIEDAHENKKKFSAVYEEGHRSLWHFCNFYGLPNPFEKPLEKQEDKPRTLGSFPNTKEGRAARKQAVAEMEARIMRNLDKIIDGGGGNDAIGSDTSESRRTDFVEQQGLKQN